MDLLSSSKQTDSAYLASPSLPRLMISTFYMSAMIESSCAQSSSPYRVQSLSSLSPQNTFLIDEMLLFFSSALDHRENFLAYRTASSTSSSGGNSSMRMRTRAVLNLQLQRWPKICLSRRERFLKILCLNSRRSTLVNSQLSQVNIDVFFSLVLQNYSSNPGSSESSFLNLSYSFTRFFSISVLRSSREQGLAVRFCSLMRAYLISWSILRPNSQKSRHLACGPYFYLNCSQIDSSASVLFTYNQHSVFYYQRFQSYTSFSGAISLLLSSNSDGAASSWNSLLTDFESRWPPEMMGLRVTSLLNLYRCSLSLLLDSVIDAAVALLDLFIVLQPLTNAYSRLQRNSMSASLMLSSQDQSLQDRMSAIIFSLNCTLDSESSRLEDRILCSSLTISTFQSCYHSFILRPTLNCTWQVMISSARWNSIRRCVLTLLSLIPGSYFIIQGQLPPSIANRFIIFYDYYLVKPWSSYFIIFGFEGAFFLFYFFVPSFFVLFEVYPSESDYESSSSQDFFTFFLRFVFSDCQLSSSSCYILAYFSVFGYSAAVFFFFFLTVVFTDSPSNLTSAESSVLFETLEDAAIVRSLVVSSSFFLFGFFFFGFTSSYSDYSDSSLSFFFLGFDFGLVFLLVEAYDLPSSIFTFSSVQSTCSSASCASYLFQTSIFSLFSLYLSFFYPGPSPQSSSIIFLCSYLLIFFVSRQGPALMGPQVLSDCLLRQWDFFLTRYFLLMIC